MSLTKLRNQFTAPVAPRDLSEGYGAVEYAHENNMTAQQVREADMAEATARRQRQLGLVREAVDMREQNVANALGTSLPTSSDNVKALTPEQRLQSYLSGSNKDPELAYDLENNSENYLEAKYGQAIANYAAQQRIQNFQNLSQATSYIPDAAKTGNVFTGALGAAVNGTRNLIRTAGQAGIMAFNSGEEEATKLREWNATIDQHQADTTAWMGNNYTLDTEKSNLYRNMAEQVRANTYAQVKAQTGDEQLARAQSKEISETFDDNIKSLTQEAVVSGLGEQAPQILLAVLSGGIGAGIAEATALGVSKIVAKEAITKLLPRIAQLGSMLGVGAEAGLQDGLSAGSDAMVGAYDYINQAKAEAAQGNTAKLDELRNSPVMQQLRQANPNATEDELFAQMAESAKWDAATKSGLTTGISAGIASPFLSGFSSKLARGASARTRFLLSAADPAVEGLSEGVEEYTNITSPREAINRSLGVEVYKDPTAYAYNDAKQAGVIGALAGSGSTVGGTLQAGKTIGSRLLNKATDSINKKTEAVKAKQEAQTQQELNKDLSSFIPNIGVMGTSETTNPDDTKVPAIDGAVSGLNMSNSKFGQTLKDVVNQEAKEEGREVNVSTDYSKYISNLHKRTLEAKAKLDEATQSGNTEAIKEWGTKLNNLNTIRERLLKDINEDITSVAPKYLSNMNKIVANSSKLEALTQQVKEGKLSEQEFQAKAKDIIAESNALIQEVQETTPQFDNVAVLLDSKLYEMLDDKSYDTSLQNKEDTKFSLADFTGTKPSTFSDVLYSTKKVTTVVNKATSQEEANNIVKAWLTDLGKLSGSISKDNAKSALTDIKKNLGSIKAELSSKGYNSEYITKINSLLGEASDKWSGKQTKAFLNKFFTKDTVTGLPSLLDLMLQLNTPKTAVKAQMQLAHFQASQLGKLNGLYQALSNKTLQDGNTFEKPVTNIPTTITAKGKQRVLTQQNGQPVTFKTKDSLQNYIDTFKEENDIFSSFVSDIFEGKRVVKPTAQNTITKPETAKDTVKEAPVSKDSGSESKNQESDVVSEKEAKNIYTKLGKKTANSSDKVVIKKDTAEVYASAKAGEGINSLRQKGTNHHYGNPFTSIKYLANKDGLTLTGSTKESVIRYIDWVLNSDEERAKWIRDTLKSGSLKDKPILYYKELNEPSHATALSYLANKYDWGNSTNSVSKEKPVEQDSVEKTPPESVSVRAEEPIKEKDEQVPTEKEKPVKTQPEPKETDKEKSTSVKPEQLSFEDFEPSTEEVSAKELQPIIKETVATLDSVMETKETKPVSEEAKLSPRGELIRKSLMKLNSVEALVQMGNKIAKLINPLSDTDKQILHGEFEKIKSRIKSGIEYFAYEERNSKLEESTKEHLMDNFKEAVTKLKDVTDERQKETFDVENINGDKPSQRLIDTLYGFGFSPDRNVFLENTSKIEGNPNKALIQALNEWVLDSNTDTAKAVLLGMRPDITAEELAEAVSEEQLAKTQDFIRVYSTLYRGVSKYLFNTLNQTGSGIFADGKVTPDISSFNGFTNLYQIDEDGNPVYSTDLVIGMTKAAINYIYSFSDKGSSNHKALTEFFEELGDYGFSVYNTSLEGNIVTSNTNAGRGSDKKTFNGNENFFDDGTKLSEHRMATDDVGFLGVQREKLIETLGKELISGMGYKFNKNTPMNVEQSLAQSLGLEVLGMLRSKQLVDTFKVEIPTEPVSEDNPEPNAIKMYYVNASFNSAQKGHFTTPIAKAFNTVVRTYKNGRLSTDGNFDKLTTMLRNLDANNNSWTTLAAATVHIQQTLASKLVFKEIYDNKGYEVVKGNAVVDKFTPRDIKDKLLNNSPELLEEAIRGHNAVGYKLDPDMVRMFESQQEIYKLLGGWIPTSEMENDLPYIKEANLAKNAMVERTLASIATLIGAVREAGSEEEVTVYIKHRTTETQRIMQEMENNPQANKIMREILRASPRLFEAVESAYSTVGRNFPFDMSELSAMVRPAEMKFKLPKPDENGVRDVSFLVQEVERLHRAAKRKGASEEIQTAYNAQVGLTLALAQALGIKIERKRSENILAELKNMFEPGSKTAWLNDLVEDIHTWYEDPTVELSQDNFRKLVDKYGNGAMRAFSVLQAFTRYKYTPHKTGSKVNTFEFNVYLEADGIGNGMSNLVRQFTVGFTPNYLRTLNRVGITTLNSLRKIVGKKGFDELSDEEKQSLADELEGSANQFDPKEGDAVRDVYEVVVDTITSQIESALGSSRVFDVLSKVKTKRPIKTLNDLVYHKKELEELAIDNEAAHKALSLANAVSILNQISVLDVISFTYNGSTDENGKLVQYNSNRMQNILNTPLDALKANKLDFSSLKFNISRSLAKLGVTPAMYGGALNGINNQVANDIVKAVQDKLNEIYRALQNKQPVDETDLVMLNNWFSHVGLYEKATGVKWDISNPTAQQIKFLSQKLADNKSRVSNGLKLGISEALYSGVQKVYGETLQNASSLIAFDTASVNAMALELDRQYKAAQEERNKRLGYSSTDPRREDALSSAEVKQIIQKLETLPVVATAFSGNTVLVEQLLEEGHSVVKNRMLSKITDAYSATNFAPIVGENTNYSFRTVYTTSMARKLKSYTAGGATNFTNTVVSTESMVQVASNFVLSKLGKALLNVYDGLDADSRLAKVVGAIANAAYDRIHKTTNLQESLFHRANRANLGQFITKDKMTSKLANTLNEMRLFVENTGEISLSIRDKKWTKEELQFLDVYFATIGSQDINSSPAVKLAQSFRTATEKATTALLTGSEEVSLNISDEAWTSFQLNMSVELYGKGRVISEDIRDIPVMLYNDMLTNMAYKAATAAAVKAVEIKHLPYVVNQFAGANRGVLVNADKLFKSKGIAKRFIDFEKANHGKYSDEATLLSAFINQDKEIQQTYSEAFNKKFNELSQNLIEMNSEPVQLGTKALSEVIPSLSDTKAKSIAGRTRNAIMTVAEKVLPTDMKIYTDKAQFIEAVQYKGINTEHIFEQDRNGVYIPEVGFYVEPNSDYKKTLTHEIVHATMKSVLSNYYYMTRDEWKNLEYKHPELKHIRPLMDTLEKNAKQFAKLYRFDPDIAQILAQDNENLADNFVHHNRAASIAASLAQAFEPTVSFTGDVADIKATDKYVAMQEFLAYALTEEELVSRMYYSQRANPDSKSTNKSWLNKLKAMFDILRSVKVSIGKIFFGSSFTEKDLGNNNNFVAESMLFEVLATMQSLTEANSILNKYTPTPPLFSTEPVAKDSHDAFLNELTILAKTVGFTDKISGNKKAELLYVGGKVTALSDDYVANLRNSGFNITAKEQNVFTMMSGIFNVTFSGSNPSLRTEAEKLFSQFTKGFVKTNVLSNAQYKALFGDKDTFDLARIMAAMVTIKDIKDIVEKLPAPERKRFQSLSDKLTEVTVFLKANRDIIDFKDDSTLEKIALASINADLGKSLDEEWRDKVYENELTKQQIRQDFVNKVEELTEPLNDKLILAVTTVVNEWANVSQVDKDNDSAIGTALQNLADVLALEKGRTTWYTQAIRWVLQAREHTQYIYDSRAKFAANLERIRENVRNLIPTVIRRKFNEEYTEEMDRTISKAVLPTRLHSLFTGNNLTQISAVLTDTQARNKEIDSVQQELSQLLVQEFGKDAQSVQNWLLWQSKGLGSLMVNRTAMSAGQGLSHHILPNSRTIASLHNLPMKLDPATEPERIDKYAPLVAKLATLHSLNHVDKTDLEATAKLIKDYPAGMAEVLNSSNVVDEHYSQNHKYNHLGTDGYVHSQSDFNVDIKIVETKSPEYQRLMDLGYSLVQHIDKTGMSVLRTNTAVTKRYQTGIFGLAEQSIFGTSTVSNEALGSYATEWTVNPDGQTALRDEFKKVSLQAMKNLNYYDSLNQEVSIKPVVTSSGLIATYSVDLPTKLKNDLIEEIETGIESIGNLAGRIVEESRTNSSNKANIDLLNAEYRKSKDKQFFMKIDGNFKRKGNSQADIYFENRVNDFYNNLPRETREYIDSVGGLYVYRNELDNLIGYHRADIIDIYSGSSALPKVVQDTLKGLFGVFGLVKINPIKALKVIQKGTQELVSHGKDIVLNRSIVVGAGNLLSNAIHLVNIGVNPKVIVPDAREGLINAQNYVRNYSRKLEIEYRLGSTNLSDKERMVLEPELKFLKDSLDNNPVAPLVQAGIMSSIAGAAGYEKTFDTSEQFTYGHKLKEKLGINKLDRKYGETKLGKAVSNIIISHDSEAHEFMEKVLDYGDFVAKYVLYKHLTQNRNFTSERAMNVIREEFVNYSMNRGVTFDYMNAMGLTWFASYALGIQKVIYRRLRSNFLGTLATYTAGSVVNDYDRLGLLGTVPHQNIFERSWSYTADISNIFNSLEAHYLARLFSWLF